MRSNRVILQHGAEFVTDLLVNQGNNLWMGDHTKTSSPRDRLQLFFHLVNCPSLQRQIFELNKRAQRGLAATTSGSGTGDHRRGERPSGRSSLMICENKSSP